MNDRFINWWPVYKRVKFAIFATDILSIADIWWCWCFVHIFIMYLWAISCQLQRFNTFLSLRSLRSPLSSPDSLLYYSGVWSGQCDPHSPVGAPTVWWWGSSQLHHHCQSRPQSSHHPWNKCSSHCALQCEPHCQCCGYQLQWKQQCCHVNHTSHRWVVWSYIIGDVHTG